MTIFLLSVLLAVVPCPNAKRSEAPMLAFKATHPCPTSCKTYVRQGSRFVVYEKCGACEVDHICPLACCGADDPSNMQWLPAKVNRAKGADCSACAVKP